MASPGNGLAVENGGLDRRPVEGGRRSTPAAPHRPRRWWIGLLLAALLVALMSALSALQAATCAGGGLQAVPCVSIPEWVFYLLHAAATVCCVWSIGVATTALIAARNRHRDTHPEP